jgi:hypothetical protein
MASTRAKDIHEITGATELLSLNLTEQEIAAVKLSYMELVSKVSLNQVTGQEETGLDRVTRKAYKIDPGLTKALFGVEATRSFDVDARTGMRKNKTMNEDSLRDDLAFIDATLDSAIRSGGLQKKEGAQDRSRTTPATMRGPGADATPQQGPGAAAPQPKVQPKKAAGPKRAASRPRKENKQTIEHTGKGGAKGNDASTPLLSANNDTGSQDGDGMWHMAFGRTMSGLPVSEEGIVSM